MNLSRTLGTVICAAAVAFAGTAAANEWNERTILTFSEPVMVPGATLAPGTYEFRIADMTSARHVIRIRNQETQQLVATVQAVPTRRPMASSETVLKFNPTEQGAPLALKAWFYPNDTSGHEFVYPETQARHIADRTKTIVLSSDAPFGDPTAGQLRTFDASGQASPWKEDAEATKSWNEWRQGRSGSAAQSGAGADPAENQANASQADRTADADQADREAIEQATAPAIVGADSQAMKVELNQLEEDPKQYAGKRISVDAQVEKVLGPRIFTIDEPNWVDLDGEIMVFMPSNLAALVKSDDRVTVTGTLKPFVETEIEEEWNWFGLVDDAKTEIEIGTRMVLVAERLVGGDSDVAMIINTAEPADRPVGTAGGDTARQSPIAELGTLANGRERLVGRPVGLTSVRVDALADNGGFYVASGDRQIFVLPAQRGPFAAGDEVSIDGVVMEMPRKIEERLKPSGELNDDIYIYALNVKQPSAGREVSRER